MDEAKDAIKLAVGHSRTTHIKFQGEWYERKVPRSITELDGDEFNQFIDRCIDYACTELGVDADTIGREIGMVTT